MSPTVRSAGTRAIWSITDLNYTGVIIGEDIKYDPESGIFYAVLEKFSFLFCGRNYVPIICIVRYIQGFVRKSDKMIDVLAEAD